MMAKTMVERDMGPGERAARQRSRRIMAILVVLALGGGVTGFIAAFMETPASDGGIGTFPPAFAIAAVITYVGLVGIGSWRYLRNIDEVERCNNHIAATWAANIYLVAYPSWYMLWKGGLAIEPVHEVLFVGIFAVMMIAYGWPKFRT